MLPSIDTENAVSGIAGSGFEATNDVMEATNRAVTARDMRTIFNSVELQTNSKTKNINQ
jgi:hypothetical protein